MNRLLVYIKMLVFLGLWLPAQLAAQCGFDVIINRDAGNGLNTTFTTNAPSNYYHEWRVVSQATTYYNASVNIVYGAQQLDSVILILEDTLNSTCKDTLRKVVPVCAPCVIPGDANFSGRVDHRDILAIGVKFATFGPQRNDAIQPDFVEKIALDWSNSLQLPNGIFINTKHVDANGDGVVDNIDTVTITENYGYQDSLFPLGFGDTISTCSINAPELYLVPRQDTFSAGDTMVLDIHLGQPGSPAVNTYGLAFSILYDTAFIKPNSANVVFDLDSINVLNRPIYYNYDQFAEGQTDAAFVFTGGFGIDFNGPIGTFIVVIDDDIVQHFNWPLDYHDLPLSFNDPLRVDANYNALTLCDVSTEVSLVQLVSSIDIIEAPAYLKIYPNPATDQLNIELQNNETITAVQLTDVSGRLIEWKNTENQTQVLDVAGFAAGIYWIQVITNRGQYRQRIMLK